MPAFIKTPKDEARWSKAKKAVSESKKKDESSFHDRDWALTNYIYHKMGKTEEDVQKAEKLMTSLMKPPKASIKTAPTTVKMPRSAKMPGAFAKPSVFFKSEDFTGTKHPSVQKLRSFLERNRAKK